MITVFGINFSVHPFFIWSKIKFLTMKPLEYNRIRLPIHSFSFPKVGGQGYQFFSAEAILRIAVMKRE